MLFIIFYCVIVSIDQCSLNLFNTTIDRVFELIDRVSIQRTINWLILGLFHKSIQDTIDHIYFTLQFPCRLIHVHRFLSL